MFRLAAPSLDFWDNLDVNIAESQRQANHKTLMKNLITGVEDAVQVQAQEQRYEVQQTRTVTHRSDFIFKSKSLIFGYSDPINIVL